MGQGSLTGVESNGFVSAGEKSVKVELEQASIFLAFDF